MLVKKLETFVPDDFLIRAGGERAKAAFSSKGLSHGGLCPHPPRNLRFLGFSFCCRLFGRTSLLHQTQAQAATIAAQRRQFALRQHQKRTPAVKPPPRRRRPRRPSAAATACRLSLPRRKPRPSRRSAVSSLFASTRNANPAVKRRPPARRPRRPSAAATARGLRPPGRRWRGRGF